MDFEVRHVDGTTVKLISSEHKCAITSATQTRKLCGNDTVTINLQSATYIDFYVGDKITIFGTTYTLNQLPTVKKESERSYTYTLVFEGLQYTLIDRVFLMPANTQGDNLMFDLAGMLDVLDDNINRGNSGKQYEFVLDESLEETEYKNLSLTGKNCLQVLQQLCQEWDTEFVFAEEPTRIAIYIGVAGSTFPTTFKYGRGGGVYELNREKGASDICTRLFVYGGTQNLTYYRHNRLCLPSKEKNQSYVEDVTAQAVYGIKEQVKNFDDIYPNRIGTITSLSGCDYNEFIDSAMADAEFGFDLNEKWANNADDCAEWLALKGLENTEANRTIYYNDVAETATKYLMAGATAKIHFNTGALAGYECDLHSYTHSSQKFVLKPLVDENGYDFPSKTNAAFKLAVGDEYVILDINLPTVYKTQAESKLATEAASYFDTVCRPQPKYTLTIEPIALKHIVGPSTADTEIFKVGDLINISDPTGGVESATIRIDQFVRNLLDPFDYKLTLTDEITYSQQVRTLIEVDAIKRVVEESKIYDVNRIRRGWKDAEELYNQMFDTEGHYYSEKIAPLSIDTQMLKVGARSQQLVLQNVLFQPNYNANPANLQISAGSLVHYTIAEPDIKTWTMSALSASNVPSTAQYVYAKCARNGTTGTWLVTDQAIVFDSENYPNDYHFLVGSLSSVDSVSNTRNFAATYGFTTINGRNITTGVIKSADGSGVIIDLDTGIITGDIRFQSGSQGQQMIESLINNTVDTEIGQLDIANRNFLLDSDRTLTNGSLTDTRTVFRVMIGTNTQKDFNTETTAWYYYETGFNTTGRKSVTFTIGSASTAPYIFVKHNGSQRDFGLWFDNPNTIEAGTYTLSFTIEGYNPNTANGLVVKKFKLEKGESATEWSVAPEDVGTAVDTANAAKDAVDNMEIGGRNILRNSQSFTLGSTSSWASGTWRNSGGGSGTRTMIAMSSGSYPTNTPNKTDVLQIASTSASSGETSVCQQNITSMVVGERYTLSFYARATSGSPKIYIQLNSMSYGGVVNNDTIAGSQWKRYSITCTHTQEQADNAGGGVIYVGHYSSVGTLQICGIQLEQGNMATDWTPAPEDNEAEFYEQTRRNLKATCSTAAGTATKVITCDEWQSSMLAAETRISIKVDNDGLAYGGAVGTYHPLLSLGGTLCYIYYKGQYSGYKYQGEVPPIWAAGMEVKLEYMGTSGTISYGGSTLESRHAFRIIDEGEFDSAVIFMKALKGQTDIFGGLILTETMVLRDEGGRQRAGMSGIGGIALWAGGTLAQAQQWIANVVIAHNGDAKFGVLRIGSAGTISMPDANGISRLVIQKAAVPTPQTSEILRNSTSTTPTTPSWSNLGRSFSLSAVSTDTTLESIITTSYTNSKHNGMIVHFQNAITFTLSASATLKLEVYFKAGDNNIYLGGKSGFVGTSGTISLDTLSGVFETASSSSISVVIKYQCTAAVTLTLANTQYWYYHDTSSASTTLGTDGLSVIKDNLSHFMARENSNGKIETTIKGDTNIGGVLWAGTILSSGNIDTTSFKNVKISVSSSKNSSNIYNVVFSNIPTSTKLSAIATPNNSSSPYYASCNVGAITNNSCTIAVRVTLATSPTSASSAVGFSLVVFGNNI